MSPKAPRHSIARSKALLKQQERGPVAKARLRGRLERMVQEDRRKIASELQLPPPGTTAKGAKRTVFESSSAESAAIIERAVKRIGVNQNLLKELPKGSLALANMLEKYKKKFGNKPNLLEKKMKQFDAILLRKNVELMELRSGEGILSQKASLAYIRPNELTAIIENQRKLYASLLRVTEELLKDAQSHTLPQINWHNKHVKDEFRLFLVSPDVWEVFNKARSRVLERVPLPAGVSPDKEKEMFQLLKRLRFDVRGKHLPSDYGRVLGYLRKVLSDFEFVMRDRSEMVTRRYYDSQLRDIEISLRKTSQRRLDY